MPRAARPSLSLSKSKYLAGLQCEKRLWLGCHQPRLATPPDVATRARFEAGTEVGERARGLFPGGVLVAERAWAHERAVRRTRQLLADASVPAVFEAAFEHAGVRIRVDVLERLGDGRFGLREVKSSAGLKPVHVDDLAVQRFVLEGSGVTVGSVELVHVNRAYVRGEGEIDWPGFFVRRDCSGAVEARLGALRSEVEGMHAVLARPAPPEIDAGFHCRKPYECEFWAHCTRARPADWILRLPGLRRARFEALCAAGFERIGEIPEGTPLSSLQTRVCEALRSGRPYVSGALGAALRGFGPPVRYLDFETMNPAIPLYPGTRPFEAIPFQWSLHRLDARGGGGHRAFLAPGRGDPRRPFAESLIAALGHDDAPVAVYSGFESVRLRALLDCFPDLAGPLEAIVRRLADLLRVVRQHVYHPAFGGSFSLKSVAPALAPGFGYDDLDGIAEGTVASAAFLRIARGGLDARAEARLREQLLAYCERDTRALLELHRALRALC